jgi:hypothetical protein
MRGAGENRYAEKEEVPMRSEADLERELDNLTFALQRDLLMLRLARQHHLPDEEKRTRSLEQLSKLRDLLTEIEALLTARQGAGPVQAPGRETDCVTRKP